LVDFDFSDKTIAIDEKSDFVFANEGSYKVLRDSIPWDKLQVRRKNTQRQRFTQ
jgi:hypothetical protein